MEVYPLDFDLKKYFHFISFELKDKFLSTFAFISQSRERFWVPHPKKFPFSERTKDSFLQSKRVMQTTLVP